MKRCPYCAEDIQDEAIVCRYCGRDLAALPERKAQQPDSTDRPRVSATVGKVSHLLALAWTLFCIVGVVTGLAATQDSLRGEYAGAAAIGMTLGIGMWLVIWFLPVVGLEAIALASNSVARNAPATRVAAKKEWQIAWAVAAIPFLLVLMTGFQALRTPARVQRALDPTMQPTSTSSSTKTAPSPSTANPTATPAPEVPLVLEDWRYRHRPADFGSGDYEIWLTLKNTSTKGMKLIDASVRFADLLGKDIYGITVGPDIVISAGKTKVDRGIYNINMFNSEQARMRNMKREDIKASLTVRRIVFDDNSILDLTK